jgi:hypothetical protein
MVFSLGSEKLYHRKPRVYQKSGGVRREIASHYRRAGARRVRFEIGEWDRRLPLVIDRVSYSDPRHRAPGYLLCRYELNAPRE